MEKCVLSFVYTVPFLQICVLVTRDLRGLILNKMQPPCRFKLISFKL